MNGIEGVTLGMLSTAMDASELRHRVTAANIANANNPDYVPLKVSFATHLDALARQGNSSPGQPAPAWLEVEVQREEGSRVQLDAQMATLASNAVHYQALAQGVSRQFALFNIAVSEGR